MITDLAPALKSSVVGIRYRANFSIVDNFGSMLDEILYEKKSFFNETFFPLVQHTKADEKTLWNNENGNQMTINSSNVILELNLDRDSKLEFRKTALDAFRDQIVKGILKKYKIVQINRIGYVNRYLFPLKDLADNFINKTLGLTMENIRDINLRFSKKYPLPEALTKKDVFDYHNAIYNVVKSSDKDEIFFSIDYQRLYEPFLESSSLIEFDIFTESAERYNNNVFLNWINENYYKV